jgi:hypothetical protein
MAARITQWTPDIVRQRIKTSHLVRVLQEHVFGETELSATQLRAAECLLRKTLPDQSAIAHTGTLELTKPEELTDIALANIASGSRNRVTEAPAGQEEPSELH